MKVKYIFLTFFILFFTTLYSQKPAEKKVGSWYFLYATHTISDNWSITTGFEERNYQTFQNYNLILLNFGVNYKLSDKFSTRLGYMFLDIDRTFEPDIDPNTIENRFYEQLQYQTKIYQFPITQRLRFEQRYLSSINKNSEIYRLRYLLKVKVNLSQKFYVTTSNESFLNFKGKLYAENRYIANLGFNATKTFAVEVGYLGHYINNMHLDRLHVGLYLKTDFRKKNKN